MILEAPMSFRETFLSQSIEPNFEAITTPSGTVRVYAMTAGEKDAFDVAHARAEGKDFRARLIVATVRDASGNPHFRPHDIPSISAYPLPAVELLVTAAVRVNRMQDDHAEAVEKN
jgi:hypothetical protein